MPMGNGTGPAGKGPGTGRGLGGCQGTGGNAGTPGKWASAAGAVLILVSFIAKYLASKKKPESKK